MTRVDQSADLFRLRRSASTEATFATSRTPTTVPARISITYPPDASARLLPGWDQRGWFLAHLSLHGISNELASRPLCGQALRKKPHASVDQRIEVRRLTWAEDERQER